MNCTVSLMRLREDVALINGYFTPPVVLFTVVTNILVCVVLLKPHMRSPTNTMLVSMALSDMFTGLVALPPYVFFYTMGRYVDYVPYDWCYIYNCLTEYLPILFHTASIWLTVALALQVCNVYLHWSDVCYAYPHWSAVVSCYPYTQHASPLVKILFTLIGHRDGNFDNGYMSQYVTITITKFCHHRKYSLVRFKQNIAIFWNTTLHVL